MLVIYSLCTTASIIKAILVAKLKAQTGTSPAPHPAMVNFTTASLEPAPVSSGWNSGSLPITFTPTMIQ